jgi:GrpB-like predicted nucleotidyltransferase (UPF0157 family)
VDYDPLWESAFIEERKRIAEALGNVAKGIEHYGSTAVPGMRAKPILEQISLGLNRGDSQRFVNERGYSGLIRFLGASDAEALFHRLAWPSY